MLAVPVYVIGELRDRRVAALGLSPKSHQHYVVEIAFELTA